MRFRLKILLTIDQRRLMSSKKPNKKKMMEETVAFFPGVSWQGRGWYASEMMNLEKAPIGFR